MEDDDTHFSQTPDFLYASMPLKANLARFGAMHISLKDRLTDERTDAVNQ